MTPRKYPQNLIITKKIFIFLITPKNIEIQNFEPPKMARAYVCMKISEYPTWVWTLIWRRLVVGNISLKQFIFQFRLWEI